MAYEPEINIQELRERRDIGCLSAVEENMLEALEKYEHALSEKEIVENETAEEENEEGHGIFDFINTNYKDESLSVAEIATAVGSVVAVGAALWYGYKKLAGR
jgi:hypothetical protein